jgi:hypothetical protein
MEIYDGARGLEKHNRERLQEAGKRGGASILFLTLHPSKARRLTQWKLTRSQ